MIDPSQVVIMVVHGNGPYYEGRFALEHSWPELQMRRLRRHTPEGVRLLVAGNRLIAEHEAFLRACPEVELFSTSDGAVPAFPEIWMFRNWLAEKAQARFKYMVTLDADAFPIRDGWLERYLEPLSEAEPVAAVQRLENGDRHADRCFLVCTSKTWRRRRFSFEPSIADAGFLISYSLELSGLSWRKLVRSNRWDPHPLTAAVYDDAVYHHGAGGRLPMYRMNQGAWAGEGLDSPAFRREVELHNALLDHVHHDTDTFLARLQGEAEPIPEAELRERGRRLAEARPELAGALVDDRDRKV